MWRQGGTRGRAGGAYKRSANTRAGTYAAGEARTALMPQFERDLVVVVDGVLPVVHPRSLEDSDFVAL